MGIGSAKAAFTGRPTDNWRHPLTQLSDVEKLQGRCPAEKTQALAVAANNTGRCRKPPPPRRGPAPLCLGRRRPGRDSDRRRAAAARLAAAAKPAPEPAPAACGVGVFRRACGKPSNAWRREAPAWPGTVRRWLRSPSPATVSAAWPPGRVTAVRPRRSENHHLADLRDLRDAFPGLHRRGSCLQGTGRPRAFGQGVHAAHLAPAPVGGRARRGPAVESRRWCSVNRAAAHRRRRHRRERRAQRIASAPHVSLPRDGATSAPRGGWERMACSFLFLRIRDGRQMPRAAISQSAERSHLQGAAGISERSLLSVGCAPFRPSAPLSAAAVAAIIETIRVVIALRGARGRLRRGPTCMAPSRIDHHIQRPAHGSYLAEFLLARGYGMAWTGGLVPSTPPVSTIFTRAGSPRSRSSDGVGSDPAPWRSSRQGPAPPAEHLKP